MKKSLLIALLCCAFTVQAERIVRLDTLKTEYFAVQDGYVLTGTLQANIMIRIAANVTFTLRNATIEGVNDDQYQWGGLTTFGNAIMILEGTNYVRGFENHWPGIHVADGTTLRITGDGTLYAWSNGYAAGIGGGASYHITDENINYTIYCGNIIIDGGEIYAYGDWQSPGIGAPPNSYHGSITITSGVKKVVVSKGPEAEYFIGGSGTITDVYNVSVGGKDYGNLGMTGPLSERTYTYIPWTGNINELTDDAEVKDGSTITGTLDGQTQTYKITIPDGAHIRLDNAIIKGYPWSKCTWAGLNCLGDATIELVNGNYVQGFAKGWPGIYVPAGKTLHITGNGSVKAIGGEWGAGIGSGSAADCGNIHIGGMTSVYAEAPCDYAAAIGSGYNRNCGDIVIEPTITTLFAKYCDSAPCALGSGWGGSHGTIQVGTTTYGQYSCLDDSPFVYNGTQDIEQVQPQTNSQKLIRNGQLLIIVEGKTYNSFGQLINKQ